MKLTPCTGAILIGGKSSRMGVPKHQMQIADGRSMLEWVAAALTQVCSEVVVVGGNCDQNIQGYACVPDQRSGLGPLAGIEALLSRTTQASYLVCPCDVPLVTADLLQLLLKHSDRQATVFQIEEREWIEPLPARISGAALAVVQRLLDAGERSVWRLMEELHPELIPITQAQAIQLHNVNTPAEFEVALRRVQCTL